MPIDKEIEKQWDETARKAAEVWNKAGQTEGHFREAFGINKYEAQVEKRIRELKEKVDQLETMVADEFASLKWQIEVLKKA